MNNRFYNIDSDTRGDRVLRKNKVDTYGAPIFAPDYSSATVLAAKMCTKSNDHSIFILFLSWADMSDSNDRHFRR